MKHAKIPASVSPQLDTLRGWSAIAVLVAHANQIVIGPTSQALFTVCGLVAQAAVMMFFALSGFLICKSITRNGAAGSFDAREYAADRFNRIAPPLAFSALLVLAIWALAPVLFPSGTTQFAMHPAFAARAGFEVKPTYLLGSVAFLNGFATGTVSANGPLWSLSFEVWYYVAAGLLASLRGRRGAVAAFGLIVVLGARNWTFALLGLVWFAGAAVALAHSYGRRIERISRPVGVAGLAIASVLGLMFVRSGIGAASPSQYEQAVIPFYDAAIGLAFAAMLVEVLAGRLRIPVVAPGSAGFSYTLYIVHFPVLLAVYGVLQPRIHGDVLASSATAIGAAVAILLAARWLAAWLEHLRPLSAGRTPHPASPAAAGQ